MGETDRDKLNEKLKEAETRLDNGQNEQLDMENDNSELKEKVDVLIKDLSALKSSNHQFEAKNEMLSNELKEKGEELQLKCQEGIDQAETILQLQEKLKMADSDLKQKEVADHEQDDKLRELQKQHSEALDIIEAKEKSISELSNENSKLSEELQAMKDEKDLLLTKFLTDENDSGKEESEEDTK